MNGAVVFEQLFVNGVVLTVVGLILLLVYQVDRDAEIVFGQQVPGVVPLK